MVMQSLIKAEKYMFSNKKIENIIKHVFQETRYFPSPMITEKKTTRLI